MDTIFSVFFALKKRTENQFRKERVDRLLIPALFLSLTASFPLRSVYADFDSGFDIDYGPIFKFEIPFSTGWFSKLSPACERYYYGNETG